MNVYIIILNFNGYKDTIECIESINRVYSTKYNIVVVDNSSTDDSVKELENHLNGKITILHTDINRGYAGGNNIGIRYAIDNGADYICILNNDTIVVEDFILPCIHMLEQDCTIAFVGPTVLDYSNGKVQSTGGDISIFSGIVTRKNEGEEYFGLPTEIECDYVGGACMVFGRGLIEAIGMIPECYFLFFEETEWCYTAKQKGYRNLCLGNIRILHKGSGSIGQINGLSEYMMNRNRVVFLKRNQANTLWTFIVYIGLCLKALISTVKYGWKRLVYIRHYTDGWQEIVDYQRYPFIYIGKRYED